MNEIIFRETNVDGCGGNAEVNICFSGGLTEEELSLLESCVYKIKSDVLQEDWDTDSIVEKSLELFSKKCGKHWKNGNIRIIEF